MFGLFHMIVAFIIFAFIVGISVLLLGLMGYVTLSRIGKTEQIVDDSTEAGKRQGDVIVQDVMLKESQGADISLEELQSGSAYHTSLANGKRRMPPPPARGKRRFGSSRFFPVLLTLCILSISLSDARIEFGDVRGRFKCEDVLRCGGDNTYNEMRIRVYPVFQEFEKRLETSWAIVPWSAADRIGGPLTCDPSGVGQCYMANNGTANVTVIAGKAYWMHQVTQYPVLEFPESYESVEYVIPNANVSDVATDYWDCTILINNTDLFADDGPCFKHACQDGQDVLVTETIGTGGGCGSFRVLNKHARLTSFFRLHFGNGNRRATVVDLVDVTPGALAKSVDGMVHVNVEDYHVPGGDFWQYPTQMPGSIAVCDDWRRVWNEARGYPPIVKHFRENNWYYLSPSRLAAEYSTNVCGHHGISLHQAVQSTNGGICNITGYFGDECTPDVWPRHVLDNLTIANLHAPPYWKSEAPNMFIKQYPGEVKTVLWPAEPGHFRFGEVYIDLLVRVAAGKLTTEATQSKIPVAALCLEEEALQCITDPYALVVTFQGRLKNTALVQTALEANVSLTCSYKAHVGPPITMSKVAQYIGTLNAGESEFVSWSVPIPEFALKYNNGVKRPRGSPTDPPEFDCTLVATHQQSVHTIEYKWEGTVSCSQFVNVVMDIPPWVIDCGLYGEDDMDMFCYIEHGSLNQEPRFYIYIIINSALFAIFIGLLVLTLWTKKKVREEQQQSVWDNASALQKTE